MDEVRDVRPEDVVALVELDRRSQALAADIEPDRIELLGLEFPLLAGGVDPPLEGIEGDLPDHGVEHVLHLGGEHGEALPLVGGLFQHRAEGQHFAEDAGGFGQGERRRRHQRPLRRRQPLVHAVPELVRERHHVARLAQVVEHQIGVRTRYGRMGEGPRRLAVLDRRVDPAAIEKRLGDPGELGREPAIGLHHRGLGGLPVEDALVAGGQRGVAVPGVELGLAEPPGLHGVIAVREPRIGFLHRRLQRVDNLALHGIVEVPAVGDVLEAVPAVGNLLVLGQHVGDVGKEPGVVVQGPGEAMESCLALGLVAIREQVQRRLETQLLAPHVELERGHGLVEQPVPGRGAGHRLLVEQLLHPVLELVGLGLPELGEPGPVAAQHRVSGERRLQRGVVDPVELEAEEDQPRRKIGQRLAHVAHELGAVGVLGVAHILQEGIGAEPAGEVVERLDPLDRRRQPAIAREAIELALVVGLEGHRFRFRPLEIGLELL